MGGGLGLTVGPLADRSPLPKGKPKATVCYTPVFVILRKKIIECLFGGGVSVDCRIAGEGFPHA